MQEGSYMKKFLIIIVSISILIVALSISYYFVIFLPQNETEKLVIEKRKVELIEEQEAKKDNEKRKKAVKLTICLEENKVGLKKAIDHFCAIEGKPSRCTPSPDSLTVLMESFMEEEKKCYERFE